MGRCRTPEPSATRAGVAVLGVLAARVMVVATSMIGYAAEAAAYLRAGDGIESTTARALLDLANIAFVLGWSLFAILLLVAAGSLCCRAGYGDRPSGAGRHIRRRVRGTLAAGG